MDSRYMRMELTKNKMILVRGGGDLATGVIHKLHQCGYHVLILECDRPSAIRRHVAFCEAVYDGTSAVEGVVCKHITENNILAQCERCWEEGEIPLLTDTEGKHIHELAPAAVVDAILAKKNLGTDRTMAPLTVGLGPGFTAGEDVDYVIETMRGHNLGRIIREGSALPNTGVPGVICRNWKRTGDPFSCSWCYEKYQPHCRYCEERSGDCHDWGNSCEGSDFRCDPRTDPGWISCFSGNEDCRY